MCDQMLTTLFVCLCPIRLKGDDLKGIKDISQKFILHRPCHRGHFFVDLLCRIRIFLLPYIMQMRDETYLKMRFACLKYHIVKTTT